MVFLILYNGNFQKQNIEMIQCLLTHHSTSKVSSFLEFSSWFSSNEPN